MAWKARIVARTYDPMGPGLTFEVGFYDAVATPNPAGGDFLRVATYSSSNFATLAEFREQVEADGRVVRDAWVRADAVGANLPVGQEIAIPP